MTSRPGDDARPVRGTSRPLQPCDQLAQRTALLVHRAGVGVLGRVTERHQRCHMVGLRQVERDAHLFLREHPHPAAAEALGPRGQHDLVQADGGVHLAEIVARVELRVGGLRAVEAHHEHHRRAKGAGRQLGDLRARLVALQHVEALGLLVAGGGGNAGDREHTVERLRLDEAVGERAHGVAVAEEGEEVHGVPFDGGAAEASSGGLSPGTEISSP